MENHVHRPPRLGSRRSFNLRIGISANVKVGYDLGTLTFEDQIIIVGGTKSFSDAGDSGSLIVEQKSKRPVGLLFAGSDSHTIANHIEDVLQQLNVSIVA